MAESDNQNVQAEAPAPAGTEKKIPPKVEIPKNCGDCNKPIAKIRYYRNMKFFCNRSCWNKYQEKVAAEKAKAAEAAAAQPAA